MSEVQRYDLTAEMVEDGYEENRLYIGKQKHGSYVKYSDYVQLAEKLEGEIEKKNRELDFAVLTSNEAYAQLTQANKIIEVYKTALKRCLWEVDENEGFESTAFATIVKVSEAAIAEVERLKRKDNPCQ